MNLNKICYITEDLDKIHKRVGFMYKEAGDNEKDSGWRFFSGHEDQAYVDDPKNILMVTLGHVVENIDSTVESYLDAEDGIAYIREEDEQEFSILEDFAFGADLED